MVMPYIKMFIYSIPIHNRLQIDKIPIIKKVMHILSLYVTVINLPHSCKITPGFAMNLHIIEYCRVIHQNNRLFNPYS